MKTNLYFSLIAIGMVAINSCKKNDSAVSDAKPIHLSTTTGPDVYVAGYVYTSDNRTQVAAYWKNGTLEKLSDSTSNAHAEGIAVTNGGDVMISATIQHPDSSGYSAVYYRNGHKIVLSNNAIVGRSQSATISGPDFYVCGSIKVNGNYRAVYWKNGVIHVLCTEAPQSFAWGILARGSNVYVAGSEVTANKKYAVYWKNDTAHMLEDTLSDANSEARGIALAEGYDPIVVGYSSSVGGNFYLTGKSIPTFWRREFPFYDTIVQDGVENAVFATENSYTTAGNIGDGGYYFIHHDTFHSLGRYSKANGIAGYGPDIYVAGARIPNYDLSQIIKPAYWKNGQFIQLPGYQGSASGIAVLPQ